MYLLVYKFGGSSVADAAGLRCAAGQLAEAAAAGFHIIAVVSAQGKTTDRLLQSTAELTAHPACREADQLLATGEQASAALMAMTLQEMGLSAVSLTGWQAGIHTDGNHAAAEITALHRRRILRELEAGKIVIVAGFQGVDREGDITTLGRGGSDTTAVALAAAFDACGCRICTDVDGVYDRDPREFPQSRRYERIPYDEMLEMAEGGAKVLHPRSVFLARKYRVPLKVLRQALRRFSAEFIDRRLRLDYTPTGLTVLTDEKWLCFVLEQLLSNALKYTREGSITVELAGERVLAIRDTGIGIVPEDLPRIFEKGYTGQNGRADKRASGLGLYLCSRICRNLGVGLTVKSTSGVGTTLLLDFTQYPLRVE